MKQRLGCIVGVCSLVFALLPLLATAQPGINSRTANTTLLIDEVPALTGTMEIQSAFPALNGQFSEPMGVFESPDGTGRLFVILRSGVIRVFPKANATLGNLSTFMDISGPVITGGEFGLLGMAFHPNYASNGEVYLHYSRGGPNTSVISRFTNDVPSDNTLPSASEDIILELVQPGTNHNGGTIAFGPDGMLYIALGDGGGSDSNRANGQDTTNLFGSVLRIDVDTAPANPGVQNYVIPTDNPFFGGTGPDPSTREEIYAFGFRNPYRFGFDQMDGTLFLADVGESLREETNAVVSGGNYGWPIMEGTTCFNQFDEGNPLGSCDQTGLTLPIDERIYSTEAISVLGGFRYYGTAVPELYGYYIYGDFVTGNIWAFLYDGTTVIDQQVLLNSPGLTLYAFGQDADGEVYLCNASLNGLSVLRPAGSPPPNSFPLNLSDLPALLAAGLGQDQTNNGIIPYAPETELWSDGALKERFIAIPGTDQIGYTMAGGWNFPADTVLIKNFSLPQDFQDPINTALRIETRLLVLNNGQWRGFSFEWNAGETDATLLASSKDRVFNLIDETGTPFNYTWRYPSRSECFQCHTAAANRVLGLNTAQMNHDFLYPQSGVTDNQLNTFDHISLFSSALPDTPANLPSSPDAFTSGATVQNRVLSYFQANCSMCHQPGGTAPTNIDLRWATALANRNVIDAHPTAGTLGLSNPRIIVPNFPSRSVLLARMNNLGSHRMPPLATSRVHQEAIDLVTEWINDANDFYLLANSGQDVCLSLPPSLPAHATTPDYQWFKQPDMSTVLSSSSQLCINNVQFSNGGVYILSYNDASGTPAQYEVTLIVSAALDGSSWSIFVAALLLAGFGVFTLRRFSCC
jgi:uncharacterized repeat protein (TIGR03806 family)